jgi:hypothetical protein
MKTTENKLNVNGNGNVNENGNLNVNENANLNEKNLSQFFFKKPRFFHDIFWLYQFCFWKGDGLLLSEGRHRKWAEATRRKALFLTATFGIWKSGHLPLAEQYRRRTGTAGED